MRSSDGSNNNINISKCESISNCNDIIFFSNNRSSNISCKTIIVIRKKSELAIVAFKTITIGNLDIEIEVIVVTVTSQQ